jgi:hypothetical protein
MANPVLGVRIGVLKVHVLVAGSYSSLVPTTPPVGVLINPCEKVQNPLKVSPPMAYILLFTTATPKLFLASCIGAFDIQEFSATLTEDNAGLAAIMQEAVKKTRTNIAATFLLMFITIILGCFRDKRVLVRVF